MIDTGLEINPVSLLFHTSIQILLEICMPKSDGGEHDCKSGYIHLRFFENPLQKNIHVDKPLLA